MSRDKQIEEMAKVLCDDCARDVSPCSLTRTGRMCDSVQEQAEALYNAGYRKASEVARDVLVLVWDAYQSTHYDAEFEERLDEIEKKYTEEGK